MASDPAFNFYTNDFDSKTKFFTHEQVGMYLRLLMAQHQHGHLTEQQMLYICGRYDKDVWLKFSRDHDGNFFNERLEHEVKKRRAYSESRKNNRKSNKSKNISSSYVKHMSHHMENEYEIENEIDLILKESFDEIYIEQQKMKWPHLDFDFELRTFCEKVRGSPKEYKSRDTASMRLAFQYQLRNSKGKNGKSKGITAQGTIDRLNSYT